MNERERFLKAEEIFLKAVEKDERQRERYIAEACTGDEALRREVLRLLADSEADDEEKTVRAQAEEQPKSVQSTEDAEYPIGETFGGRYLIESKLGQGGIGAVYLASDTRLYSRPVVVKLLLDTSNRNQYLIDKFKHEGEGLARINHPGVVKVYDLGELADGKPYLVMEFVKGKELASEIEAGGMDFERAATIIRQIAQALSAAHYEGIIHRDLKPANVMIQPLADGAEQARLIDFGIARISNPMSADATLMPVIVGTPDYMAPEQIETGEALPASDIYALGAIAYEMLTAHRPFKIDRSTPSWPFRQVDLQRAGVRSKPKQWRMDLPLAAQDEILRALSYNPAHRHQTAFVFGESLYRALTGEKGIEPSKIDLTSLTIEAQNQAGSLSFDPRAMMSESADQAAQSFERLWSKAVLTDRIHPMSFESAKKERAPRLVRGLGAKPNRTQYTYQLGSEVCIILEINRDGYLTLLNKGAEGTVYSLCPSRFAPGTRLQGKKTYLPQEDSPLAAFKLSGEVGKEKLLAIISDEPLGLDWMPDDEETPARELSGDDIESLFARLQALGEGRWTALSSYFEVVV